MKMDRSAERRSRYGIAIIVLLAIMFAGGVVHWLLFFHFGKMSFQAHDWQKEYTYYAIIQEAVKTGTLPYHVAIAFQGTNRFLALPETNLSPQILLLPLMSVGRFVLVNVLLLYSAGFAGCLLIMRRYRLSILGFLPLFLLFNLNGHLTAQIGVGHSMWGAYFLLPFYALLILEIAEGRSTGTTPIKMAFVLFLIVLQGGLHIYVWALTFLVLYLLSNPGSLKPAGLSIIFSGLLSAFRILPAAFSLAERKERFIWSYPTLRDLLDSLVTIRQETPERLLPWGTAGWWEYDVYIGLIGLAFILWFGVVSRFRQAPELHHHRYKTFDLPLLLMGTLSVSYVYAFITRIPLPVLRSERVATRFIVLPLVMLVILASIRFNDYLSRTRQTLKFKIAVLVGAALTTLGFIDHSFLWSVVRLERIFRSRTVDLSVPAVIHVEDGSYRGLLLASSLISVATAIFLLYLAMRYRGGRRTTHA
jgi:hypothetical protein